MNFYDNIPIYIQIANDIKEKVVNGQLKENSKLLSVRELSTRYEVTALTVQRAMQQLEAEGVIRTKKGVGSFITEGSNELLQKEMIGSQIRDFVTRMRNLGLSDKEIVSRLKEVLEYE